MEDEALNDKEKSSQDVEEKEASIKSKQVPCLFDFEEDEPEVQSKAKTSKKTASAYKKLAKESKKKKKLKKQDAVADVEDGEEEAATQTPAESTMSKKKSKNLAKKPKIAPSTDMDIEELIVIDEEQANLTFKDDQQPDHVQVPSKAKKEKKKSKKTKAGDESSSITAPRPSISSQTAAQRLVLVAKTPMRNRLSRLSIMNRLSTVKKSVKPKPLTRRAAAAAEAAARTAAAAAATTSAAVQQPSNSNAKLQEMPTTPKTDTKPSRLEFIKNSAIRMNKVRKIF